MRQSIQEIATLAESCTDRQLADVVRLLRSMQAKHRNINADIEEWCKVYKTSRLAMRGPGRRPAAVMTRWELMTYLHEQRGYSSVEIGIALNRDHSTVLQGILTLRERMAKREPEAAE